MSGVNELLEKLSGELAGLRRRVSRLELLEEAPNGVVYGFLNVGAPVEVTISSGEITVTRTFQEVETEGGAASDDLDTINGGTDGDVIILKAADSSHTVVVKDATGNLQLNGDFSLTNAGDTIVLIWYSTTWRELARSDNTA